MGVFALALDVVHGDVRVAQQVVNQLAVIRVNGNANAGRDVHGLARQQKRWFQAFQKLLGNQRGILPVGQFGQHGGEFIAAQARQRVAAAQAGFQPGGRLLQQLVAHHVPQRVIDQLEAVQVNEHHRQPGVIALGLQHRQAQPVFEQHAVGQVGQDVVVSLVGNQFVSPLAVGDVPRHAINAKGGRLTGWALARAHRNQHQFIVEGACFGLALA